VVSDDFASLERDLVEQDMVDGGMEWDVEIAICASGDVGG
jgi:hypothetical protein